MSRGQLPLAYRDQFVPIGLVRLSGPFPPARALPSRTPTITATPLPTLTPTITPTPGPSPTPTKPIVSYPDDPETIVLQVGWSDTDQPGLTWEEMNGTPYFTLYGDGRLIAGDRLFDWRQELRLGNATEAQIQDWLYNLTYEIEFFTLDDEYVHPDYSKFAIHTFVRYGKGARDYHRTTIRGFTRWLRDPLPAGPDVDRVRQTAEFVKRLEEHASQELEEAYYPDRYTVLSMEVNPYLPAPPAWEHSLDIVAVSDSAPLRWGDDYVHGPPGHLIVGSEMGLELSDAVSVDAKRDWPGLNLAAEYALGVRRFVVGIRKEVPGGSDFLPPTLHEEWYRDDG